MEGKRVDIGDTIIHTYAGTNYLYFMVVDAISSTGLPGQQHRWKPTYAKGKEVISNSWVKGDFYLLKKEQYED
jgi:hypothetical protein